MRIRNLVIESDDSKKLNSLLEDYKLIGFDAEVRINKLTVFCINRKLKTRKQRNKEKNNGRSNKSFDNKTQVSKNL